MPGFGNDLFIFFQQGIEIGDEIGIHPQKYVVEMGIQFVYFMFDQPVRFQLLEKLLHLPVYSQPVQRFTVGFEFVDVVRMQVEELSDILFLDHIRFGKQTIRFDDFPVLLRQSDIALGESLLDLGYIFHLFEDLSDKQNKR